MKTTLMITGYLVGSLWWPVGAEAWKDFSYDIAAEQARSIGGKMTLRDHVLRATNDGDLNGAEIAAGELVARREYVRNGRRIVETRTWSLYRFPSITDCLHADPEWIPVFDFEDAE